MKLVLFLLCAGFFHFTFASNRLRFFNLSQLEQDGKAWDAAVNECNKTDESLVTVYDEEDIKFIYELVGDKTYTYWLGLRKNRNTTWSDGVPVTFTNVSVDVTNGDQICIAIVNNTWKGFNCSDKKPFMCYRGNNNYILIENSRTWCQALQYCRNHFTDLVSISNKAQNEKVIEKGNNITFWIGLMCDDWEWNDRGCSSFREWDTSGQDPMERPELTKYHYSNKYSMKMFKYDSIGHPFCSNGFVRIRIIQQNRTWEEAFEYCEANHTRLLWIQDNHDQAAVDQWLEYRGVKGPFWIGLRQSRVFGFWIWTSDTTVTNNNWKNNKVPEMPLSNHCGVIEKDDNNYKWRDENCFASHYFLCEEDIIYM